jgi:exopolyphosphatase / guanosine-5'-triphosphate,3'-diphosphate pyrophosphatase
VPVPAPARQRACWSLLLAPMANAPSPPPDAAPRSGRAEMAAAVDLGSNSFHMVVGRIDGGQLHIVDRLRERVRLAAGLDADDNIADDAMDRAIACLKRFGQRVDGMPADRVRVVGTNTLRKAKNARAFMQRAREALHYPIEIVSGREEARLIYLGVAQTTPEAGRRLVVDIGGGSTEVIVGEGFDIVEADSLYMGCVSFSERFFGEGKITAKGFRDAQLAAELELQSIVQSYRQLGWQAAVGCSGTIHAVHDIVRTNGWAENGITAKALKKLRKALLAAGTLETLELPGLAADRKSVIAGGVAILEAVFLDLRIEQMTPSPGALREGVLYDLVGRINHEDVRDRTIRWFQQQYQVDPDQADRAEKTALTLLDQATRTWDELDEEWARPFLTWAARLHEIGLAISHTGHHKHGAYIAANAHMAGFSREEQQILAALVGSQRRRVRSELFEDLDPAHAADVIKLVVLFRLAVRLNRGRDAERPPFVLRVKKDNRLRLHFPDGWLLEHPLTRAALDEEAVFLAAMGFQLSLREQSED